MGSKQEVTMVALLGKMADNLEMYQNTINTLTDFFYVLHINIMYASFISILLLTHLASSLKISSLKRPQVILCGY